MTISPQDYKSFYEQKCLVELEASQLILIRMDTKRNLSKIVKAVKARAARTFFIDFFLRIYKPARIKFLEKEAAFLLMAEAECRVRQRLVDQIDSLAIKSVDKSFSRLSEAVKKIADDLNEKQKR